MKKIALSFALVWLVGCQPATSRHRAPSSRRGEATPAAPSQAAQPQAAARPAARPAPSAAPAQEAPAAAPASDLPAGASLMNPPAQDLRAPDTYTVELDTTKGPVLIDVTRAWAPRGADRFYTLVRLGYFQQIAFFRAIEGFMVQAGIHGDPAVNRVWQGRRIPDDPVTQHNTRGMVTFATSGRDSRVNQFFINYADNSRLDPMGFAPFGRVRDMAPVDALYTGYGEGAPAGRGPVQGYIVMQGNTYLQRDFPQLDYIRSARVVSR